MLDSQTPDSPTPDSPTPDSRTTDRRAADHLVAAGAAHPRPRLVAVPAVGGWTPDPLPADPAPPAPDPAAGWRAGLTPTTITGLGLALAGVVLAVLLGRQVDGQIVAAVGVVAVSLAARGRGPAGGRWVSLALVLSSLPYWLG